jgi:NitT/TauT family transport system substrate-binding protein
MTRRSWLAMVAAAIVAIAACSPSESASPPANPSASTPAATAAASPSASPTSIRVRLPGPLDGEFAGYIAAQKLGYFSDQNLAVNLQTNDPASLPADYYKPGATGPEFTIADAAPVLAAREHDGSDLVNIAQIFQRSGTVLLTWTKDFGSPADICALDGLPAFKGKKVGLWPAPADVELTSSLATCSATAANYTRVDVGRDVSPFLSHAVDAIQGESYDQLAQVLEATNPATNQQFTTADVLALPPRDDATAHDNTLQDGIYASKAWLAGTGNRDVAVSFITAVTLGWVYCRDHQDDCVQFTTQANSALGTSHTRWMINEVNGLIWPSLSGIGALDQVLWQRTITVATGAGLISKPPTSDAFDDSIVTDAASSLAGDDLSAPDFQQQPVAVAPGGK